MQETVYVLCSHSGESKVDLIYLTLYGVLYTVLTLTDLLSKENNASWGHASYILLTFRKFEGYL